MVEWGFPVGETSASIYFRLRDATTGLGKTGLAFDSAGATATYTLKRADSVAITLVTLAAPDSAYSSGGFVEVNATNAKGLYRLDLPNAVIAARSFALVSLEFDGTIEETQLVEVGAHAVWEEILTGATHNVNTSAGRRARQTQENLGYEGGAVWIDTVNGATGTVNFENGTADNPSKNIADANTIAASVGLARFKVAPGSSITFVAPQQAQEFEGSSYDLALGGVDIANISILGANLSGVGTGVGTQYIVDCNVGAATFPDSTHVIASGIIGTQTLPAGDIFYDRCHSAIAGMDAPQFDFGGAVGDTRLNARNHSGGLDIRNHGALGDDVSSIEGRGQVILNANCVAGTMEIRGLFSLTDNSATVTITRTAMFQHGIDIDNMVAVIVSQMLESYAALNTAPTMTQLLHEVRGLLAEYTIVGTVGTLRGIDGATSKETFVYDDPDDPTSISRQS